jgi:hypothetical protein
MFYPVSLNRFVGRSGGIKNCHRMYMLSHVDLSIPVLSKHYVRSIEKTLIQFMLELITNHGSILCLLYVQE